MGSKGLEKLLEKAQRDGEVLAVMLFGSAARREETRGSDLDVCLVLRPGTYDRMTLSRKRLDYLSSAEFDTQIFQQLPLYIRRRVLKEGKVLLVKDEDALYELAFRTAQAFEDFRHFYREYLEEVARG